jgi:hypothetical protein
MGWRATSGLTKALVSRGWTVVSTLILTKRHQVVVFTFNSTPESSDSCSFASGHVNLSCRRNQCIFQQIWTLASRLLLRGSSKGRFYSSHSIVNLLIYLFAKFGALNPRMNEIRSSGNRSRPVPKGHCHAILPVTADHNRQHYRCSMS